MRKKAMLGGYQIKPIKNKQKKNSFLKQLIGFRPRIALVAVLVLAVIVGVFYAYNSRAATAWPLKVSENNRYLVDQNGKAFLYTADTSWTLVNKLTLDSAKKVIDIRKEQGFNAIQISLSGFGRTIAGPQGTPFQNGDLTKPNEAYFKVVDDVIKYAETKDMVIVMTPFWLGDNGGKFGGTLPSNAELQSYASFLGNRYKNSGNIIWFVGGDDAASSNNDVLRLLGSSLAAADPNHLMTVHNDGKTYQYKNESWYDFYGFQWNANSPPYTYEDITEGYGQNPVKPVINMEPAYDPSTCCGTDQNTTPLKNRRNGWWAILSGAMGIVYGGPRDAWNASEPLKLDALNREPAKHTANINKILSQYPWEKLEPDNDHLSVTGGRGKRGDTDYATAGRASDGSLIVAYTPSSRTLTVNMAQLSGPAKAYWVDPTNANTTEAGTNLPNNGSKDFATPGNNAGGDSDFVLIITTGTQSNSPAPTAPFVTVAPTEIIPTYECIGGTNCVPSATPTIDAAPTDSQPDNTNPTEIINPPLQPDSGNGGNDRRGFIGMFFAFLYAILQFFLSLFR